MILRTVAKQARVAVACLLSRAFISERAKAFVLHYLILDRVVDLYMIVKQSMH